MWTGIEWGEFLVANANSRDASNGFEQKRWAVADKQCGHMHAPDHEDGPYSVFWPAPVAEHRESCVQ